MIDICLVSSECLCVFLHDEELIDKIRCVGDKTLTIFSIEAFVNGLRAKRKVEALAAAAASTTATNASTSTPQPGHATTSSETNTQPPPSSSTQVKIALD